MCIYAAAGERGARAHRPLPPRCAGDAAEDARVDGQGVSDPQTKKTCGKKTWRETLFNGSGLYLLHELRGYVGPVRRDSVGVDSRRWAFRQA